MMGLLRETMRKMFIMMLFAVCAGGLPEKRSCSLYGVQILFAVSGRG